MSFSITPSMVQRFEIDQLCMERYPCGHSCKITLSDGRERKTGLDGDKIYVLINAIADEKIVGNDGHFDCYLNFTGIAFPGKKNNYSRPIPEDILSNIFKK